MDCIYKDKRRGKTMTLAEQFLTHQMKNPKDQTCMLTLDNDDLFFKLLESTLTEYKKHGIVNVFTFADGSKIKFLDNKIGWIVISK